MVRKKLDNGIILIEIADGNVSAIPSNPELRWACEIITWLFDEKEGACDCENVTACKYGSGCQCAR